MYSLFDCSFFFSPITSTSSLLTPTHLCTSCIKSSAGKEEQEMKRIIYGGYKMDEKRERRCTSSEWCTHNLPADFSFPNSLTARQMVNSWFIGRDDRQIVPYRRLFAKDVKHVSGGQEYRRKWLITWRLFSTCKGRSMLDWEWSNTEPSEKNVGISDFKLLI